MPVEQQEIKENTHQNGKTSKHKVHRIGHPGAPIHEDHLIWEICQGIDVFVVIPGFRIN